LEAHLDGCGSCRRLVALSAAAGVAATDDRNGGAVGRTLTPRRHALREIVVSGLRADPADRPQSLDSLLDALGRDPGAVRRRLASGSLVAAVVAVDATALAVRVESPRCAVAERKLVGIWDPDRKLGVQRALLASDKPWAGEIARLVTTAIDGPRPQDVVGSLVDAKLLSGPWYEPQQRRPMAKNRRRTGLASKSSVCAAHQRLRRCPLSTAAHIARSFPITRRTS
jgi:hypothetical protein